MTNQEIYEKVRAHLLNQKVQSVGNKATCLYRGLNGTSCAVGCLIKDEFYDPEFESNPVADNYVADAVFASIGVPFSYCVLSFWSIYRFFMTALKHSQKNVSKTLLVSMGFGMESMSRSNPND